MRITNTWYTPIDVVSELIASHGITAEETQEFFSENRSSHDWLVDAWGMRLEVILKSFKRYGTEVAETHFIRDHGVDIRLSFENKEGESRRIGFQIKSEQEAIRDSKRPRGAESLVSTLKRQAFEAQQHAGLQEWWIISCFNLVKHRKLVSAISAELTSGTSSGPKLRHVTPREAMALLEKDDEAIDAICTLLLCEDDEVLRMARQEIRDLGPAAQRIVLYSLGPALEGKRGLTVSEVQDLALPDDDSQDTLAADVNALETDGFLRSDGGEDYIVEPAVFVGLCALYFEARARHQYDPRAANRFVQRMTEDVPRRK